MTTAQTIITRARYRTDKLNSTFINDTNDCLPWADHGHRELYDILIAAYGQEYFLTTVDMYVSASTLFSTLSTYLTGKKTKYIYTITQDPTVSITTTTTIETGTTSFYKLIRFDRSGLHTSSSVYITPGLTQITTSVDINEAAANESRVPFRPFEFSDVVLSDTPSAWDSSGRNVKYRLSGDRIYWHPRPQSAEMVRMYYIPLPGTLSALTDSIDTWCEPWVEYPELYVARAIAAKEQDDAAVASFNAQMAQVERRIMETAPPRDAGQPQSIVDVRGNDYWSRCMWPDEVGW